MTVNNHPHTQGDTDQLRAIVRRAAGVPSDDVRQWAAEARERAMQRAREREEKRG